MEYRQNQNHQYRRDYQRNPYDRGPPRGRGENSRSSRGYFRPYRGSFQSQGNQNWRSSGSSYPVPKYQNYNQPNQGNWETPEVTFDERGREVGRTRFNHRFDQQRSYYSDTPEQQKEVIHSMVNPQEEKARDFLSTVLTQQGIRSKLIFLKAVASPIQTLMGAVDNCQLQMTVEPDSTGMYVLKIDNEEVVRGTFDSKQIAKNVLAEQAVELLRKDCFYIVKKKVYEEVTTKKNEPKVEAEPQTGFQGSKAHQMMLKMGWGGKGLGVNEQGAEKTVAETLDQNVSRQGLGTDNVFKKIHKLLEDYSKSEKISLLRFDPDFTSEERAHIHKMAAKFGLKSKSEGKGEERRITITKKLNRGELVYNLLTSELENSLYKLIIPSKFEHLWHEDEDDDEKYK